MIATLEPDIFLTVLETAGGAEGAGVAVEGDLGLDSFTSLAFVPDRAGPESAKLFF